jgi:hypothetical protein
MVGGVGSWRFGAGWDGCAAQWRAAVGHERHRVDRLAVDLDLEVQVEPGGGLTGGSFDPEPLAHRHDGSGSDLAVDAGQVCVASRDGARVAEGDHVAVGASGADARDGAGGGGNYRTCGGEGGEVLAGVQPPFLIYGVEAAAVG